MASGLGITDYGVIAIMLLSSAVIGVYFRFTGGRQRTTDEYFMGSRNMSVLPVTFSLMTTFLSAITLIAIPADVYMYGTQYLLFQLGLPIGTLLASYIFLPVFFKMQAKTAYEYIEKRFGKTTRIIASLQFCLYMVLYMAIVLYAPALTINAVTGVSLWGSILTLAGVCSFYSSLGGLKAVLWSDVLQSVLMFTTLIAVVIKGTVDLGGLGPTLDIANDGNRLKFFNLSFNLEERYTFWNTLLAGLFFTVSTFGTSQSQIQRLLSLPSLRQGRISLYVSTLLIVIFQFLCIWCGVILFSLYHNCDPILDPGNTIKSPDQLFPNMVLKLFSHFPGVTGLCLAGIFSASLSSMSSAMNSLAAVTVEDFIRPYSCGKELTESRATFIAKLIALAYGGLSLLMILIIENFRGILEAIFVIFGLMVGPMQGVFTLGVLTTTANEPGTLLGFSAGLLLNGFMAFGSYTAKLKSPHLARSIEGCAAEFSETSNIGRALYNAQKLQTYMNSTQTEENRYVFPLFKVTFIWHPIIGALSVIIIGYICSYIVGCFRKQKSVKSELICPMLHKWFFKIDDDTQTPHKLQLSCATGKEVGQSQVNDINYANEEACTALV